MDKFITVIILGVFFTILWKLVSLACGNDIGIYIGLASILSYSMLKEIQ